MNLGHDEIASHKLNLICKIKLKLFLIFAEVWGFIINFGNPWTVNSDDGPFKVCRLV